MFLKSYIKNFLKLILIQEFGKFEGGGNNDEVLNIKENKTEKLDVNIEENNLISEDLEMTIYEDVELSDPTLNLDTEYNKFKDYLNNNPELGEKIVQLMEKINPDDLSEYLSGGYIIGIAKLNEFNDKFGGDLLEEQEAKVEEQEAKVEKQEAKVEKQEKKVSDKVKNNNEYIEKEKDSIINLKKRLALIEGNKDITRVLSIIENISFGEKTTEEANENSRLLDEIKEILNNKGVIEEIAKDLFTNDIRSYESFKKFATGLDSSFQERFDKFESFQFSGESAFNFVNSSAEEAMVLASTGTTNPRISGNIVSNTYDGKKVVIDTAEIPPKRYLNLENSDYQIRTDLPVGNFYKVESNEGLEFEKTSEAGNKVLDIMSKVENIKLDEEDYSQDFGLIKQIIAKDLNISLSDLNESFKKSKIYGVDNLKNFIENKGFANLKLEIEKEIEDKKKNYRKALKNQIAEYKRMIEEDDKKSKDVLSFISKTGFDLLPQSLTDQLIRELKMNSLDIPGFKIDYTNIDISEGKFGESPTETDAIKWKENLMLFMNKAIYGEFYPENSIIDPAKFIGPMGARVNPTKFNSLLEMQGIKTKTGFDISQIRENLKTTDKTDGLFADGKKFGEIDGIDIRMYEYRKAEVEGIQKEDIFFELQIDGSGTFVDEKIRFQSAPTNREIEKAVKELKIKYNNSKNKEDENK